MAIAKVNSTGYGVTGGDIGAKVLPWTPAAGNVLVAVAGGSGPTGPFALGSITQSDVAWTRVGAVGDGSRRTDFWVGRTTGPSPSSTVTFQVDDINGGNTVAIAEYSGFVGNPTVVFDGFDGGLISSGSGFYPEGMYAATDSSLQIMAACQSASPVTFSGPTNSFAIQEQVDSYAGGPPLPAQSALCMADRIETSFNPSGVFGMVSSTSSSAWAAGVMCLSDEIDRKVTRAQSAQNDHSSGTNLQVSLSVPPADGNTLVAVVGLEIDADWDSVSSITSGGATWERIGRAVKGTSSANGVVVEIWAARNVLNASTSINILRSSSGDLTAAVTEYAGLPSGNFSIIDTTWTTTGDAVDAGLLEGPATRKDKVLFIGGVVQRRGDTTVSRVRNGMTLVEDVAGGGGTGQSHMVMMDREVQVSQNIFSGVDYSTSEQYAALGVAFSIDGFNKSDPRRLQANTEIRTDTVGSTSFAPMKAPTAGALQMVVVGFQDANRSVQTVTQTNALWKRISTHDSFGGNRVELWVGESDESAAPTGNIAVNFQGSASFVLHYAEYDCLVAASVVDLVETNVTVVEDPNITASRAIQDSEELVIGFWARDVGDDRFIDTGWSEVGEYWNGDGGSDIRCGMVERFTDSAITPALTANYSGAGAPAGAIGLASFRVRPRIKQMVQVGSGVDADGAGTVVAFLPKDPTPGNTLIAIYCRRGSDPSPITPTPTDQGGGTTPWTLIQKRWDAANGDDMYISIHAAYDVSASSREHEVFFGGRAVLILAEYRGIWPASPKDLDADAFGASGTALSGTTGVTTYAEELWLAALHTAQGDNIFDTTSVSNGFVLPHQDTTDIDDNGTNDTVLALLEKFVTAAAAASTSATRTEDAGEDWQGMIATFRATNIEDMPDGTSDAVASSSADLGLIVSLSATTNCTSSSSASLSTGQDLVGTSNCVASSDSDLSKIADLETESFAQATTPGLLQIASDAVLPQGDIDADEALEMVFQGDAILGNFLKVGAGGSATGFFERDVGYSGPDYRLGGPPDPGGSPIALGFKPGDKLRLIGSAPNGGREFTLSVPDTFSIREVIVTPDSNTYSFQVVRKKS